LLHLYRLRTRVRSGSGSSDLRDNGRCCTGRDSSQAGIRFSCTANKESRSCHAKKNPLSTTNPNRELLRSRCVFRKCKLISSWAESDAYGLTFDSFANFLSVAVNDWSATAPSPVGCVESDKFSCGSACLGALATFGVGFITRPLGAAIVGLTPPCQSLEPSLSTRSASFTDSLSKDDRRA
jgi:hypothetical protein